MTYQELMNRKMRQFGNKFSTKSLSRQFIRYFEGGERIEVKFGGEVVRGRVGVTTGWQPCFLLMLTTRSIGSSYCLSDQDKIIKVVCQQTPGITPGPAATGYRVERKTYKEE